MNIGGIGNTGIDYTKLTSRQLEQQEVQQESEDAQVQAAVSVQQKEQPDGAQDSPGGFNSTYNTAQNQTSAVAAASQQLAESLKSDSDSEEDTNTALINKANSGLELTQAELSQLKSLDAALYAQALKAQKSREDVRAQMSRDPSSAAGYAKQAIATAMQQDDSSAVKAIMDEYTNFASKYDQMDFGNNLFR